MPVRFEYRIFDADYIPQYFNSFYEIERFSVLADGVAGLTKQTMVQGLLSEEMITTSSQVIMVTLLSTLQGWFRLVVFSKLTKAVIIS